MAGQVDEPTKKRRAAELLSVAADARTRWAARHIGNDAHVLFETRLDDGRWVGHAADHVLVAVDAGLSPLENRIERVHVLGVDSAAPDRVIGALHAH